MKKSLKHRDLANSNHIVRKQQDLSNIKVYKAKFEELSPCITQSNNEMDLRFLEELLMNLKIELGKTMLSAREILKLEAGSVIALDRIAGENIDILLNEEYFGKGEVIVLDDSYGIRITSVNKE